MAKEHDMNTPKSMVERGESALVEHAAMPQSQVAMTTNSGAIGGSGSLKSGDKAKEQIARKELQHKLDAAALRYMQANPAIANSFVTVRATKTQHPAPRVGTFNFQEVYNCFIEGMRYKCPNTVAQHLEETENANILG